MLRQWAVRFSVVFACCVAGSGCSDLGQAPEALSATADGLHLMLSNTTEDTLYYFITPTAFIGWIDWTPCVDPGSCHNRVAPHRSVAIAYTDFWWLKTERSFDKVTIYWWKLVKDSVGTYRVDAFHSVEATIR